MTLCDLWLPSFQIIMGTEDLYKAAFGIKNLFFFIKRALITVIYDLIVLLMTRDVVASLRWSHLRYKDVYNVKLPMRLKTAE